MHLISHNKNNNERVSAARVRELAIKRVAELRIMEIIQITDSYSLTRAHGSLTAILWKKNTNSHYQTKINVPKKCWQKSTADASNTHNLFFSFFCLSFFLYSLSIWERIQKRVVSTTLMSSAHRLVFDGVYRHTRTHITQNDKMKFSRWILAVFRRFRLSVRSI